jgi:catechol 2,3-dioxygenase-like lactoylglutathione lyase family enzyme
VRLRVVRMQLGNESIELTEYLTPKGKPIPVDSRSNDRWFQHIAIAISDMDKAYQHLRKFKVQHASTAPQRIPDSNKAAAGIRAFYFKDPDGHNLEIIYFPPGKGDPKWQKPSNQLFLGIDHTAIVVSNTEASLKFYRDLLGLTLAGESMNYGTEQEHLNNVEGAKLHISGLRSLAGPGIEFLEYLTPKDGRSLPNDARPNDLLHWQTTLVVKDAEAVAQRLRINKSAFVSPSVVAIPGEKLGFKKGFLVRDPDGHVMRVVQK